VVDADAAGLHPPCDVLRMLGVPAPHAAREPEFEVVGDRDGVINTVVGDHREHRAEDLLPGDRVAVIYVGEVAEEAVYGTITTGAEGDIEQLTMIARQMVGRWGMSDAIGLVAVLPADGLGPLMTATSETSQATQQLIDDEVRRLIDTAHREVTDVLTAHREQLDNLTAALLHAETLDGIDAYRAAGMPMHADPAADAS
jgi:cell division protease FtsH